MNRLKKPLKKSRPAGKVSPELKTQRRFSGKNRAFIGFWNFCLIFVFLSGLIFSKDALANLYENCELPSFAPPEQIEKAWRKWRGSFHSDRPANQGPSQKKADKIFAFINDKKLGLKEIEAVDDPELKPYVNKRSAFYVLRDPTLREKYDKQLKQENEKRRNQKAAGNSGQNHTSGQRRTDYKQGNQNSGARRISYRQGDQTSGASGGRRTWQQSADKAGLLHEAILSAEVDDYTINTINLNDREERALQLVQTVLERDDTDIDAVDPYGRTALYLAAERAYFRTVQALLLAGANPNIPDHFGKLPVHAVVSSTFSEERVYEFFLQTFMFHENRHEALKNWLVSYEIFVEETLLLLVRFKADLSKKTHAGETVIETAMKHNRWDIAHWFLDQGAHYLNDEDRESLSRMALQNNQKELLRRFRNSSITSPAGGAPARGIGQSRLSSSVDKIRMKGFGIIAAAAGLGALLGYAPIPGENPADHRFAGAFLMGLIGIIPAIPFFTQASAQKLKECHDVLKKYPYIKQNIKYWW